MTDAVLLAAGAVQTPSERLAPGWVHVSGERIAAVGRGEPPEGIDAPLVRLADGATVAPGFVDLHIHGSGGAQVGADAGAIADVARFAARHGTTTLLPTTVPSADEALTDAVRAVAAVAADRPRAAARVLGSHLEGPFVSPARPGALEIRHLRSPDPAELRRLLDAGGGTVRAITVAPELDGAPELIGAAAAAGLHVSLGHTDATYAEAMAGFAAGAHGATHLFNAMRPLHHREPGIIGAALSSDEVRVELIADGVHVHPAILRMVHAAKGPQGVALVTDAMMAAGLPDGQYALGDQPIAVVHGEARTESGSLAGSTLTLDRAVRVCVEEAGIPLADALEMASTTPAALLGLDDAGRIAAGARADLVVLDAELRAIATMLAGRWAHGEPGT
jgi:N-acetylglucosamine-6-phosphate deacetylase